MEINYSNKKPRFESASAAHAPPATPFPLRQKPSASRKTSADWPRPWAMQTRAGGGGARRERAKCCSVRPRAAVGACARPRGRAFRALSSAPASEGCSWREPRPRPPLRQDNGGGDGRDGV